MYWDLERKAYMHFLFQMQNNNIKIVRGLNVISLDAMNRIHELTRKDKI